MGFDNETIHYALKVDGDTLSRPCSAETNPYCFGKQIVSQGIAIWRFKIITPFCYFIGIVNANYARKNSCHTRLRALVLNAYGETPHGLDRYKTQKRMQCGDWNVSFGNLSFANRG